jgi:hypothetical protein
VKPEKGLFIFHGIIIKRIMFRLEWRNNETDKN